jgi:riboflavin kinase/FMN adenylyltransferase
MTQNCYNGKQMRTLYTLSGKVKHGHKRGKQLGFPTINFAASDAIKLINEGLYLSQTKIQNKIYNSLTFIGQAKTFNQTDYLAETYILDFSENVYNTEITVQILKKLRDNKKFDTPEELVEQMKKDEEDARSFFLSISNKTGV